MTHRDEHHDDDLDEVSGLGHRRRSRRRRRAPAAGWMGGAEAWPGGPPPPGPFPFAGASHGSAFFGGPGRGRRARRGGRARRGDIRAAILLVLLDRPMHGYEVMSELSERSGGVWRPSPGSVYPTLQQLEDEDLVRSEEVDHKRVFRLTEAGTEEAERVATRGEPWNAVRGSVSREHAALHQAMYQLAAAVHQIAGAGTDEQVGATRVLLDDTRRQLYRMLAEDGGGDTADR